MAMSPYIFIVFILIILSMYRERTVKPGKLLIIPLLLLWGVSASFQPSYFHSVLHVAISGMLLLIGLACGFSIGKMVNVRIHPETGKVTSRGSLGSVILILVILSLRMAARIWLPESNEIFIAIIHSMFFIPLGTITARNIMLYKAYRRLTATKVSIQ
ncbi:DUF1453 domain-containing protein [Bacillus atrophaeus]|uniref:DUF1453 domain-containing protein n=1 Tax=Bacillus atrophaeus TaxID=1452 RepID=UPI00227F49A4|nr:DUF1453 domain-containing protein [Bacillus atrophaeus]MCY8512857.1 DUF1453 domain-containing protein [Bacillus atrophaeus]MCY8516718.1 DUF1453 domain-containing protein [Bacillus atrophaeus]MCY8992556.1 DUF1453 domain-containing protein [Bacillus atrophaeus]MCY9111338.1 DUF1453 domain-containing protein [Bacillus atrophaeus]MCY9166424.1 DUF1453 domain-containing protein [Bacillus atrophaeus]